VVLNEQYMGICFGSGVWDHNLYCSGNRGVSCSSVCDISQKSGLWASSNMDILDRDSTL